MRPTIKLTSQLAGPLKLSEVTPACPRFDRTAVFYQYLPAGQSYALAQRLKMHYILKSASWLNMAELGLSPIARQHLHQRIPTQDELSAYVDACVAERNAARATVHWQFALDKARHKLQRHYQKVCPHNFPD